MGLAAGAAAVPLEADVQAMEANFKFQADSCVGPLVRTTSVYQMAREDLEGIVKFGTIIHGEGFFSDGLRILRHEGKVHAEILPEGVIPRVVHGF